jgi:hypothetical protein
MTFMALSVTKFRSRHIAFDTVTLVCLFDLGIWRFQASVDWQYAGGCKDETGVVVTQAKHIPANIPIKKYRMLRSM